MDSKAKTKRTRPAAPRDARLHLRLSDDEKQRIEVAAAAVGEDVSVWIRRVVRERLQQDAKRSE
jgi:uncharacterized protein (DUF1778 family)